MLSLETIALEGIDDKVEGQDWARGQIRLLMRVSVRLASVAIPTSLERLLLYEKVMMAHLDRGMKLFGLGEHAGKHTLIMCVDAATVEKLAKRAPVVLSDASPSLPASAPATPPLPVTPASTLLA